MAKHRIGGDYFRHIASYLCKVYSDKPDFKRYIALLGFYFGADYFQGGTLVLCTRGASWWVRWFTLFLSTQK